MTGAMTSDPARPAAPEGLPRLLAGWRPGAPVGLDEHFARFGPVPWTGGRRRGLGRFIETVEHSGLQGRGGAGFPTRAQAARCRPGPGRAPGRPRERIRG